jgi:hypothetical protein
MTTYTNADFIPLTLTRGSDLVRVMTFGAEAGDMTGWTFDVLEVVPASLASVITCTLTSAAARTATISAPWGSQWPSGTGVAKVTAYIRINALDVSLPQIRITIE